MTDREIVELLERTGHLEWPFGKQQRIPDEVWDFKVNRPLRHPAIEAAIGSYQDFLCECLDPLCMKHHGRPAKHDGQLGPATMDLMAIPRCGCPDYGPNVQSAMGNGSWKGCHGIGDFHAAMVEINRDGMPGFLEPAWEEVWARVVEAYDDIGLRWTLTAHGEANVSMSFVSRSRGWIGLAVVGQNESCSSQIWAKFLSTYKPADIVNEWSTLIMHELGHNAGLNHTRGGVMSPSIVNGLPASWKGDPSRPVLARYYGGEPIPGDPKSKEYWVEQGMRSNRGREVWTRLTPPILVEGT